MSYLERLLERGEYAINEALAIGEINDREAQEQLAQLRNNYEAAVDQAAEQQAFDRLYGERP